MLLLGEVAAARPVSRCMEVEAAHDIDEVTRGFVILQNLLAFEEPVRGRGPIPGFVRLLRFLELTKHSRSVKS